MNAEVSLEYRSAAVRLNIAMTRHRSVLTILCLTLLAVTACSGDSEDNAVKRAEVQVQAKQKALSDAQSAMQASADTFCDTTAGYLQALDRYGDVLTATTPTVGDVKDSGSELAAPQEAAVQSAQAAVDAQQALIEAKQELSDAKTALKQAKSGTTSQPSTSATTPTASPLAPADSVNRVKRAETQFQSVQQGITDQTPLAEASVQFNAAAVALEMSWLALFADAGCLTDEQHQQAQAAVSDYTVALQQALTSAGYYSGEIDGIYGPDTVDAVQELQRANGLPVTGAVDKATEAALQAELQNKGTVAAKGAVATTAALRSRPSSWLGSGTVLVDGEWTPALTEALQSFQSALGVKPTGEVDAATVAAFEKAIAEAQEPPTSPPPTSPPPTGPTTSPTTSKSSPTTSSPTESESATGSP